VRRFFNEIKDSVKGWFGKDETDQDAHAEYEQAWNDDAHWQGRVKETAQNLEQQGRFGGPPAAGSSSGNV